jgi:hypothetical protein
MLVVIMQYVLLQRGGFAIVCAGCRLRWKLGTCFPEGIGVLEEAGEGLEAFASAEELCGREAWASVMQDMPRGVVKLAVRENVSAGLDGFTAWAGGVSAGTNRA